MPTYEASLAALDARMDGLRDLHRRLQVMDLSCDAARTVVKETAESLVTRIGDHESRLLAEIEAFRDTQYKKCGSSRGQFDAFVHDMDQERDKLHSDRSGDGGRSHDDSDSQGAVCKCELELRQTLEILEKKLEILNISPTAPVHCVQFSPIRCNTAFGLIHPVEDPPTAPTAPTEPKRIVRSLSLANNLVQASLTRFKGAGQMGTGQRLARRESESALSSHMGGHMGSHMGGLTGSHMGGLSGSLAGSLGGRRKSLLDSAPISSDHHNSTSQSSLPEEGITDKCRWKITTEGSALGQINCPNDVIFVNNGDLLIADRDNKRLQMFDREGKPLRTLVDGKLKPRRLATLPDGNIAATDSEQNGVHIINVKTGAMVKTWSLKKKGKVPVRSPCGVGVLGSGHLVLSDLETHSLSLVTKDGKSVRPFQPTSSYPEFHSPSYVSVDTDDRVLVSDSWYQTLYVFDRSGKLEFEASKTSPDHGGHLKYPNGICGSGGAAPGIYVADWGNHTVSRFSRTGEFMEHVLTREDGILHPAGVAVSGDVIAVTEYSDSHSAVGLYSLTNNPS